MKIWLLTQTVNNACDTYGECVVMAETEDEARYVHPAESWRKYRTEVWDSKLWADPKDIVVKYLGVVEYPERFDSRVICTSYRGG